MGEPDINTLIARRGQIKAIVTRFQNYLKSPDCDIKQIPPRQLKIEEAWQNFELVQTAIEELENNTSTTDHSQYRIDFENLFFETVAEAEQKISSIRANQNETSFRNSNNGESINSTSSIIKLAALNIPVFNGSYNDWVSFKDIFTALIHTNSNLTPIQKFFYLRSSLNGDAANCIKNFETTAINYEHAWKTLTARYNNEKLLIQCHVKDICELNVVKDNSSDSLRMFSDSLRTHISALEALKQRPTDWGPLLIHIICSKLDSNTLTEWEVKSPKTEIPKIENLMIFLDDRAQILEAVNEIELCKLCLRKHDSKKRCLSRNCFKCGKTHNTLLHIVQHKINNDARSITEGKSNHSSTQIDVNSSISAHSHDKNYEQVLLSTAIVRVFGENKSSSLCRALLDSGSQSNFITEELVQCLKLKRSKTNHQISGIGTTVQHAHSYVIAQVKSKFNDYSFTLKMLVVPKITNDIPAKHIYNTGHIPQNVSLADPLFWSPQKVDLLIGATHFYDLMSERRIKPVPNGPIFQETKLGWVVSGPTQIYNHKVEPLNNSICYTASIHTNVTLENMLPRFWRVEEFEGDNTYTIEEKTCKSIFDKTVIREPDGRFTVHLPFRENSLRLGESYNIAKRRLLNLESRLANNTKLKNEYTHFMNEYTSLGHMEQVQDDQINDKEEAYYLPHHAVFKEASTSTRLRVVFDASCKTSNGVSLNDVLLKGPVLQDDLVYILARFRTHNFVLSADITKMYRQFWVTKAHRIFQRILWRTNPQENINIFQLNTVTYGTVPASFLATGCLHKLADSQNVDPIIAAAIKRDFYMDDFLGGTNSYESAVQLRDGLIKTMQSAGLELRKWASNNDNLIKDVMSIKEDSKDTVPISDDNSITKVLGLFWNSTTDTLQFEVQQNNFTIISRITKREILSVIACLFDPLGLVGPAIIRAKLMLQQLWRLKIQWDEPLPNEIQEQWITYRNSLCELNNLIIPRQITCKNDIVNIQIHGFADASINAYGCCLYLRCTNSDGVHTSKLICAKSKVAPLKVISLPRLELCAALLLSRLSSKIVPKLNLKISKSYFWSDSNIVLSWITSPSTKWKTFVAHRVGEIQERTSIADWSHVDTKENPADIISRGCCPSKLSSLSLWWFGPKWLIKNEIEYPVLKTSSNSTKLKIPEAREITISNVCTNTLNDNFSLINHYSSINKLIHVTAYCLRFRYNALHRNSRLTGMLSVEEIKYTRIVIIRCVQKRSFPREIKDLIKLKNVSASSKLFRLCPFIDHDGLIKVGGRLKNAASIDIYQRHPIVLPADDHFTRLLFKHEHERCMHGGPQATLSTIRLQYWPLNGRNIARSTVHKCVKCFKYKPIVVQPIMGQLPADRVEPARAFLKCGIDFAGPFLIKSSLRRNAPLSKSYVCIFVCFTTKATHLELVSDLSTQAFIGALNRFFDRRGKSSVIYSDNATNFAGANNKLKEWYDLFQVDKHKTKLDEVLKNNGVQWKFIPARSPHFGGLWESAVKSMKNIVRKTLGDAHLTYEEFNTVLTRAEACLNSRPLTPLSTDPNDLGVLTPGHFLIGDSLLAIPEPDISDVKTNRLTRWRRLSHYSQIIWKKWSREYLNQLQERKKWSGEKGPKLDIDTVVLVRDENISPLNWKLGRVTKVQRGPDDIIRSAEVKLVNGCITRAVRNLCPLPFDGNISK
ncbi:uncharacterized protein LOC132925744 [Rhopalosiphum padi]|uniref:uncharacterized protein LOC132925744 n=1 Tax=Rhopalosiphum padi TaxID=40932 RepID=UPI00298DA9F1|nr:uncharacterized protein LOC132925744 [Rhopalosiphum padi]